MSTAEEDIISSKIDKLNYTKQYTRRKQIEKAVEEMQENTRIKLSGEYECECFRRKCKEMGKRFKTELNKETTKCFHWGYVLVGKKTKSKKR